MSISIRRALGAVKQRWQRQSYSEIHRQKSGNLTDKWSLYLEAYEQLFRDWRTKPVRLLEIGIQNGGSLEVWAKLFRHGRQFIGCDIDERCRGLVFDDERISLVIGDATTEATRAEIVAKCPEFDLVIDDGSHTSKDIMAAFSTYFPLLVPGGLFVVEDTHALYWESHGGGLRRRGAAQELFKQLTDVLNVEHWRDDTGIAEYLADHFRFGQTPQFILDGWVDGLEFRNSLIVIRKALVPTHEKLGKRVVCGTVAHVEEAPLAYLESTTDTDEDGHER